ncbi:uncharacterized protein V6R79_026130 [Siganus canaliculatus]
MDPRMAAVRTPRILALCARTVRVAAGLHCGAATPRRSLKVQTAAEEGNLKSMDELPGPSLLTTLYWLFVKGYGEKSHKLQILQKNLYGPIWRSRIGPYDLVNVASPEFIAQVIQQEGRYPVRADLPHWKEYRDLRGRAYGLHVDSGPEWHRMRSVLNPKMLKLQEVAAYAPVVHQVVSDLLQRIQLLRSRSQDQVTVPDVAAELYKFGFEGISAILFETRLGCLQDHIPPETQRFIGAVGDMLLLSQTVPLLPRWSRRLLPLWSRFVSAWDDLHHVAHALISRRMSEVEAQLSRGEQVGGVYLTHLLASDRLSRAELETCVTELLLGGVDTTSNTLSWALYHLAQDRRAQDRLHAELSAVCPDRRQPTTQDLSSMPYLKAVIKEVLRLYPVVPGNGRLVSENEVIVGNYWFPEKTQFHLCHYAACHSEADFPEPECFLPERWLRPQEASGRSLAGCYQHHPYSFIPFGVGVRACVGKRVAEMEMYFALSRVMQLYEVQLDEHAAVVEPKTRTLLIPEKPINLRFLSRS